jgi:Uma2 family endonuclease
MYARAGIPEYWVVDVKSQQIKVFRQLEAADYRSQTEYSKRMIDSLTFPDLAIAVTKILGWE